jgi:hypothetical protein
MLCHHKLFKEIDKVLLLKSKWYQEKIKKIQKNKINAKMRK